MKHYSNPLFAPNSKILLPIIASMSLTKRYIHEADVMEYVSELLKYHYKGGWKLHIKNLLEVVRDCLNYWKQLDRFNSITGFFNQNEKDLILDKIKKIHCTSNEDNLFAIGITNEDIKTSDNDCYETAGGFRDYLAKKGSVCKFCLDENNRIYVIIESSLMTDSYNDNIFGNSTGGGRTEYKYGENQSNRIIYMGLLDEVIRDQRFSIIKIDYAKGANICSKNIDLKTSLDLVA